MLMISESLKENLSDDVMCLTHKFNWNGIISTDDQALGIHVTI